MSDLFRKMDGSHIGLVLKFGIGEFQNRSTTVRGGVEKIFSKKIIRDLLGKSYKQSGEFA